MRKLIESTFVTLDGVISDPQNWGPPYWDDEHNTYAQKLLYTSDALLLGRVTYEGFAQAWTSRAGSDEYTDRINEMPKHVASTTLKEAEWNATVIEGDVAAAVAELKQQPGENILKFGTGVLDRALIEHGLVDEFHFWVFPVVAGSGTRLLDGLDVTHFELLETTRFASGIVVNTYGPK
jgi:dihydrofolate reductase